MNKRRHRKDMKDQSDGIHVRACQEDQQAVSRDRVSLVDFLRNSPLHGIDLDVQRSREPGRQVDL